MSNAFLIEQSAEIDDETIDSDVQDTLRDKTKPKKKTRPGIEDSAAKRAANITNMANGQNRAMPEPSMYMHPSAGNVTGAEKRMITTDGCLRCGSKTHFWRQCPHPFRKDLLSTAKRSADTGNDIASKGHGKAHNPSNKTWLSGNASGSAGDGLEIPHEEPAPQVTSTDAEMIDDTSGPSN